MSYCVRIVGPSGTETYLCRGREVSFANATLYSSPSAALRAMHALVRGRRIVPFVCDVIDTKDPERVIA